MTLLINREGRQLGPYTLEQARALVLAGEVAATDWAWPEGAARWMTLKEVPGFSAAPVSTAAFPASNSLTASLAAAPPEEELWRGRPSQILLLRLYFVWALLLLGILSATLVRLDLWPLLAILVPLALVQIALRNLRLRAIAYVVTTQRVRIISGLLNKEIQEIELFRVKDTSVRQRFFQRIFGLGTITILSGDAHQPRLVLYGIPRAVELRERLRQEVMQLRQRFGVRELDVM